MNDTVDVILFFLPFIVALAVYGAWVFYPWDS